MCIIGIAHQASGRFPLIVAANRDERHARPTAPAAWWPERPDILSGRDLVAGGTWLGITTGGRFAAVTNVFDSEPAAGLLSRGALVGNFLVATASGAGYGRALEVDGNAYGPFNLLLLDGSGLQFASNRRAGRALTPGIHACSNNLPGTDWPKVAVLGAALRDAINGARATAADGARPETDSDPGAAAEDLVTRLLGLLAGPAARGTLDSAPESLFIVGDSFGTRCSTVIVVAASGEALFVERSFAAGGIEQDTRRFRFRAQAFAGPAR